ncbi:MAG: CPBP family intramembrane glutamic endopeptidase [Candidatus Micrarchaeia archaeon]
MGKQLLLLLFIFSLFAPFIILSPPAQAGMVIASFFFFMLAVFLASLGKKPSEALGQLGLLPKKGQSLAILLLFGGATVVACAAVSEAISLILHFLGVLDVYLVQAKILSLPPPILLFAVTLAPLAEESLFRGAIFKKSFSFAIAASSKSARDAHLPFLASALLSSALFSLMHVGYGSIAELVVAFSIGMVLCMATARANSLIPAVVAHACFNFASIIFTVILA